MIITREFIKSYRKLKYSLKISEFFYKMFLLCFDGRKILYVEDSFQKKVKNCICPFFSLIIQF